MRACVGCQARSTRSGRACDRSKRHAQDSAVTDIDNSRHACTGAISHGGCEATIAEDEQSLAPPRVLAELRRVRAEAKQGACRECNRDAKEFVLVEVNCAEAEVPERVARVLASQHIDMCALCCTP